jgi:hypothetical protein
MTEVSKNQSEVEKEGHPGLGDPRSSSTIALSTFLDKDEESQ